MEESSNEGNAREEEKAPVSPMPVNEDPTVISLLECPVCYENLATPIFQCVAGHLLCGSCRGRVHQCPTCRGYLGELRNIAMEKMAEAIALPCRFKDNGCQVVQKLQKRRIHEQHCLYRTCECPTLDPTCSWEGAFQTLVEHLRDRHRSMVSVKSGSIKLSLVGLESTHPLSWAIRMNCHGHEFIIQAKKSETGIDRGRISLLIRFVGSKKGASRFRSFLLVGGKGKALAWNSPPKSVMEETRKIIEEEECLTVSSKFISHLLINQTLSVIVSVEPMGS
ncbi:E3 ubiquitin-protein ligase SIAH1B-like [Centruroides sculpturatus]|uniref:E3 ubiquitin-protein ligase SIAH1B-like n=1 Tax=Centruroides sculpturatus TaxID=218467 RepID=UPI000C6CD847|nr:E3 ubiquitin-protein ligase SIAH1B-like [Centruroides sculpturatus]